MESSNQFCFASLVGTFIFHLVKIFLPLQTFIVCIKISFRNGTRFRFIHTNSLIVMTILALVHSSMRMKLHHFENNLNFAHSAGRQFRFDSYFCLKSRSTRFSRMITGRHFIPLRAVSMKNEMNSNYNKL